ncbi:ribosome alternative rescue factor ArfA [Photobacterium nomapromontoriensis]
MMSKYKLKVAENIQPNGQQGTPEDTDHGRGVIRDNALKAVVTSTLFRTRIVKAKKGKGSFQRKDKHLGRESYSIAA